MAHWDWGLKFIKIYAQMHITETGYACYVTIHSINIVHKYTKFYIYPTNTR